MMPNDNGAQLETLRQEMRVITSEIMQMVSRRMEIANQIGDLKTSMNLKVKDEKTEAELRIAMAKLADTIGLRKEFASKLLNLLLSESESIQSNKRPIVSDKKVTHLGIFARARELEQSGMKLIHMEVGEPDYSPPASVKQSLQESFDLKHYHYTETLGLPKLRRAIAEFESVDESKVIVTPGGRFAVFCAISGLLKSGDELIVIEPAWPAYAECAEFAGATVKSLKTQLSGSWKPDISELENMISPSTKMIAINYPNNPTGKIITEKVLQDIVAIAEKNSLFLLSDEVYSHYAYTAFQSISKIDYTRAIVIQSFSKTYAMTGFRVGYAIANQQTINIMKKIQGTGITSVAEPIQYAALSALPQDTTKNTKLIKDRLDFVCSRLGDFGLKYLKPDGGMYVFPALPQGIEDMNLVEKLLDRGVAVAPGSGFGNSYNGYVRLSVCQPLEDLGRGLEIINDVLHQ